MSRKVVVTHRMSPALHHALIRRAEFLGVSLNQLYNSVMLALVQKKVFLYDTNGKMMVSRTPVVHTEEQHKEHFMDACRNLPARKKKKGCANNADCVKEECSSFVDEKDVDQSSKERETC